MIGAEYIPAIYEDLDLYTNKEAREKVAWLINADPEEILFTSCGTESDNTAIQAAFASNSAKRHIVTTRVEHPAIKNLCEYLAKNGYRITYLPVDREGRLDMDRLKESLTDDTAIVSIMCVSVAA